MKYKVGDKVRVKPKEELLKIYTETVFTLIHLEEYTDTIVTISDVCSDDYRIKEDGGCYRWYDKDFVGLAEEQPEFVVLPKTTKLLLVEDGSVDFSNTKFLEDLGIGIVVYRKGATKPELIDLEK